VVVFLAVVFLVAVFLAVVVVRFLYVRFAAVLVEPLLVLHILEPKVLPALESFLVFNLRPALLHTGEITLLPVETNFLAVVVRFLVVARFLGAAAFGKTIGNIASRSACFLARICLRNLFAKADDFLRLFGTGTSAVVIFLVLAIIDKFVVSNI
jgi:hypothetical protein